MKITKILQIVSILVLVAVIGVLFAFLGKEQQRHENTLVKDDFAQVLQEKGFTGEHVLVVDTLLEEDGREYRTVVQLATGDAEARIGGFVKEDGVWDYSHARWNIQISEENGSSYIFWTQSEGNDAFGTDSVWHFVYCANNALKKIEIPEDILPAHYTVEVLQQGEYYILHFYAYMGPSYAAAPMTNMEFFNQIHDPLMERGYIDYRSAS